MPTTRYVLRRSSRAKLTQTQELELWLGVCHYGTTFASDEHRRAAWFHHRDRLMRWWGKDGKRPMGWWWYEAPEIGLRFPGSKTHERSILWETPGVLSEDERAQLEAQWRREWDRCWDDANFSYCAEPGKIYTGDEARVYHLLWADVPPALVYLWLAERERRGQVVAEATAEDEDHTGKH
jgi:hypothetical protein